MFDFFSNTYSIVATIFAAILGMSFPLILQSIQRIDEKYDSTVLSNRFNNESKYILFKWILYVYAVIVCLAPFFLSFYSNTEVAYWINTFLLLYVLGIIITLFLLFDKIAKYYNIEKLLDYLSLKKKDSDVLIFWDIMRYASKVEDDKIYQKANQEVVDYFVKEQYDSKDKEEIVYSASLYQVLYQIGIVIGNTKQQSFLYNRNDIIPILYNTLIKNAKISQQTFNVIWFMLNNASFVSNSNWIKNYWTYANQYIRFRNFNHGDECEQSYLKDFYTFNIMVGTMLVYHRNYSILNHIMTFSQSQPLSFPLIPGTFSKIIEYIEHIHNLSLIPIGLENKYPIKGIDNGVDINKEIARLAYKYLSLLFIRLWSYQDYNINYSNPFALPYINNSINENEQLIRLSNKVKEHVEVWYKGGELRGVLKIK